MILVVVWEGAKALGGDPWRFKDASGNETVYVPPFKWPIVDDLSLPHVWEIGEALVAPVQRQQPQSLAEFLVGAAIYTGREAALGFLAGALLGLGLAAIFVHSKLAERAFMPYIVASQTIPILAIAPMVVGFAVMGVLLGIPVVAIIAGAVLLFDLVSAAFLAWQRGRYQASAAATRELVEA